MKVIVFGASGGTGRELVTQLLAAGHEVTAFVRDAATAPEANRVRVVVGDVVDRGAVAAAIAGHDAVVTALGSRSLGESDLLDRASANLLDGMRAAGVRRIVVLGAAGALHDAGKHQSLARRAAFAAIKRTLLRHPMADSAAQERRIESSDTDFTIVHPPRLTDGPRTGSYRVMADGLPREASSISRADVADFMVRELTEKKWLRRGPYISK